jgi:hypothetical protein
VDDDVTAAVRAFRAATTTSRGDASRRRIYRSIEAQTQTSRRPLVIGAIALGIAAAVVLAFGGIRRDTAREDASHDAEQSIDAADRRADDRAIEVVPAELDPSMLPREAVPPQIVAPAVAPIRDTRPVPVTVTPPTEAIEAAPDLLKREAALLLRARKAVLAKDPTAARAALDAHAQQFPRGELAPERWKLSIQLACADGRHDAAARAAAAFANAHPDVASAKTLRDRPCDSVTNEPSSGQSSAGAR